MTEPIEDPYAADTAGSAARANRGAGARRRRRAAGAEVRSEADHFAQRLRDLGATDDEIGPVLDSWDELEDDDTVVGEGEAPAWTAAYRTALVSAPDDELRYMIATARDEYAYANTTEAEANDADKRSALAKIDAGAADVIGRSVADVLAWVDNDPDRARAALALETAEGQGANRKTLVGPLAEVAGSVEVPGVEATMDGEPGPGEQLGPEGMDPVSTDSPAAAQDGAEADAGADAPPAGPASTDAPHGPADSPSATPTTEQ